MVGELRRRLGARSRPTADLDGDLHRGRFRPGPAGIVGRRGGQIRKVDRDLEPVGVEVGEFRPVPELLILHAGMRVAQEDAILFETGPPLPVRRGGGEARHRPLDSRALAQAIAGSRGSRGVVHQPVDVEARILVVVAVLSSQPVAGEQHGVAGPESAVAAVLDLDRHRPLPVTQVQPGARELVGRPAGGDEIGVRHPVDARVLKEDLDGGPRTERQSRRRPSREERGRRHSGERRLQSEPGHGAGAAAGASLARARLTGVNFSRTPSMEMLST